MRIQLDVQENCCRSALLKGVRVWTRAFKGRGSNCVPLADPTLAQNQLSWKKSRVFSACSLNSSSPQISRKLTIMSKRACFVLVNSRKSSNYGKILSARLQKQLGMTTR